MSDGTKANPTATSWHVIVWKDGKPCLAELLLTHPLHWRTSRTVNVCQAADLFDEAVPDEQIDKVFAVMALAPQHQFMVLTKHAKRMREYICFAERDRAIEHEVHSWHEAQKNSGYRLSNRLSLHPLNVAASLRYRGNAELYRWPIPNVALGVTAEDQTRADERIPELLATPAAKRFVSIEPMLGPVDLGNSLAVEKITLAGIPHWTEQTGHIPRLDLVICGGESGPDARPMHPDWPRSLRDQCAAASVPFNFKQWGEWAPSPDARLDTWEKFKARGGRDTIIFPDMNAMDLVGKRRAGRLLDGVEYDGMLP